MKKLGAEPYLNQTSEIKKIMNGHIWCIKQSIKVDSSPLVQIFKHPGTVNKEKDQPSTSTQTAAYRLLCIS